MSNDTAYQKDLLDKTIKESKSRVFTFNYSIPDKKNPNQPIKASLWKKAKKVEKLEILDCTNLTMKTTPRRSIKF
ncbi:hypothetical protein H6792_01660 [Candidatus Nomurabacteria bacterium]|nr:hypothetical protein [Candidatus Nomurabacteria bacterium]